MSTAITVSSVQSLGLMIGWSVRPDAPADGSQPAVAAPVRGRVVESGYTRSINRDWVLPQ